MTAAASLPKLLQPALKALEKDLLTRAKTERVEAGLRRAWEDERMHCRGDLRFLEGVPPEHRGDGLEDCRIYQALLEIAKSEPQVQRAKYLVTRDADFQVKELLEELGGLCFKISQDPSKLYAQLRSA